MKEGKKSPLDLRGEAKTKSGREMKISTPNGPRELKMPQNIKGWKVSCRLVDRFKSHTTTTQTLEKGFSIEKTGVTQTA